MGIKVVYFGIYSKKKEYPRNNNIISALRYKGVDVTEAHMELADTFLKRINVVKNPISIIQFFCSLLYSFIILTWKLIKLPLADVIIVGYPGYFHIHLAWAFCRIFRRKAKLVYDVFIPLYEALVEDRELVAPGTILAWLLYQFERSCCRIADLNLIDTNVHGQYLINTFGLCPEKVVRIFVGATIKNHLKYNFKSKPQKFKILFVGTYIPLDGIDVILAAARILADRPEIRFVLVGNGQLKNNIVRLANEWELNNIEFIDWIAPERLYAFIRNHDLSLGIFGTARKTKRVIPSKIFDICKAGVPFITSDSIAIREAFSHGENAYLVPAGDAQALAQAILHLQVSPNLRKRLAIGASRVGRSTFSINRLGTDLLQKIDNLQQRI